MLRTFLFLIFALSLSRSEANVTVLPCALISITAPEELVFSQTELRLICGDDQSSAYDSIPLFQAEFHLRSFLEARAYLEPSFSIEKNQLLVHTGQKSELSQIKIQGVNDPNLAIQVHAHILRFYQRKDLTPALLDQIEASVHAYFADQGYACMKIQTSFNVEKKLLIIDIQNLVASVFGEVEQDPIEGFSPSIISRSRPFKPHHQYRQFYLTIHEKRLIRSGVVQGSFYRRQCYGGQPSLRQSFVLGPPRVLRFGAGFNSEVGPLLRARWTHQRKGKYANTIDGLIETSLKQQKMSGSIKHYVFRQYPRAFGLYGVNLIRDDYDNYEEIRLNFKPHLGINWDSKKAFNEVILGPNATTSTFKIDRDKRRVSETSGALEFHFRRTSHLYEDDPIHPRQGSELLFMAEYRHPTFGFNHQLARLESSFVSLHNILPWGRGDIILGQKLILGTTLQSNEHALSDLPPSLKFYAGGSHDVRGHGLNELPQNNGAGALSKMAIRLEARKTAFIRDDLELAIFFDAARLSEKSFSSIGETPYSPGLALRWHSPIGLIQTYAARTLFTRPHQDLGMLYFIGLGGGL
jgi:translocation and assembly module TamA